MSKARWKVLTKEDVSPSSWFPIIKEKVALPSGQVIGYFRSQLPNVAMVIPITKEKEIVFVRQYKHGIGEMCVELPAGRIEAGQSAEDTAVRELWEETGIAVKPEDLVKLIELWTEPSKSSVRVTSFLATNVSITEQQNLEETENIELLKVPLAKLDDFIASGEINASDSLALLLWAKAAFSEVFRDHKDV